MSIGGYKIRNKQESHFLTYTIVEWVDVFTRKEYRDILVDSFRFCQQEKGLVLHGWCVMSNHVHLIASAKNENLSDLVRDFKKFTGRQIIEAIEKNERESRKRWMLSIFSREGHQNLRNKKHQFWIQENHPVEVYSSKFTVQKLNYIHENPVKAGIVEKAENYIYSSARDYLQTNGKQKGLLEVVLL
jgi:putative transposase